MAGGAGTGHQGEEARGVPGVGDQGCRRQESSAVRLPAAGSEVGPEEGRSDGFSRVLGVTEGGSVMGQGAVRGAPVACSIDVFQVASQPGGGRCLSAGLLA